jgi:hypothetical protein
MPVNLLALCRLQGSFIVKRVKVAAGVQQILEGIFTQQEQQFFEGVSDEILFDGGWRPEKNELLYVAASAEAAAVFSAAQSSVVSLPELDASHFSSEGIRALCVLMKNPSGPRLLLQNFTSRQILEHRFSLILDGDTFNRLTQPAFSIGSTLAGLIEGDRLKFNSFNNIRLIFDLKHLYQEATDIQIDSFSGHSSLFVADPMKLKITADQSIRKLIHAIAGRGTLDQHTADEIVMAAATDGLVVDLDRGKIVMPTEKRDLKTLLHFLDDGFYRARLSGQTYITNSKRRASLDS